MPEIVIGRGARVVRLPLPMLLMMASGFAGLGYQIVWTQQSALWLGHESAAVLAVVAAFFGGLAIGAWTTGPHIERSAHPVRWYVACEALIAAWGLVLIGAMASWSDRMLGLVGVQPSPLWQWTVAFVGTFFVLLPATAAMGATLPAMERITARMRVEGRSIAAHYAANTFGAVLGVLASAFWLVPTIGLTRTAAICISLNVLCAAIASTTLSTMEVLPAQRPMPRPGASGVRTRLALTGLIGIGYEVLVVRVLSQVSEDTVYTFALLLAVYLLGSAGGAAAYQRWFARQGVAGRMEDARVTDRLLCALAAACLLGTGSLWFGEDIKTAVLDTLGRGMPVALGAEAALAVLAFAAPTLVMGALFSHLCARASAVGIGFGRALGINIVGAAAAPLLFGVLLAPAIGPKLSLLVVVAGYLALTTRRMWSRPVVWVPASLALLIAVWAPRLAFIEIPEGGHLVSYLEGVTAAVSVVEDADGVLRLRIDDRQQEGSSATRLVDGRQAWLPVLLHPAPRHALFLGLGTGITASSAAEDPLLEVDAVELLPEVIASSRQFTQAFDDGVPNPRLHVLSADARRFVRTTSGRYDVIVADNFHPARGGSGALYTVEHFRAVRERLADGGLFCQWLPLHQLDLDTLRSIVQSFMTAYPGGWAMLASNSLGTPVVGLVGARDGARFDWVRLRDRLQQADGPMHSGIADEFALLGGFVAGPEALRRFAGSAAANTDDHPVVAYRAPLVTYAPTSTPPERLMELLSEVSIVPSELVVDAPGGTTVRLAAYWAARDRFIELGRHVQPTTDVRDMLAQVREPLLAILATSPDFRSAYDPLLRMASDLAHGDPITARGLLGELAAAQPVRPEAGQALRALDSRLQ